MTTPPSETGVLSAFSNSLADLIEQMEPSVVAIHGRRRRSASGVHWRPGIIVTTEQGIGRDETVQITLSGNISVSATLIGRDASTDLAVLRLTAETPLLESLPSASLAEAQTLKVGHLVLAIARSTDSTISASLGVISSLGGGWRTWQGGHIDQLIRPSLNLYSGFSGSPLVDVDGQVVGINTVGPHHLALTIPASTVNRVVDQLVDGGRVRRGYLGLGMQPVLLPEIWQRSLTLSQPSGVLIVSVEPNTPAEQAGVLIGDILTALDGNPLVDISDVHAMLDADRIGTSLVAQVIRGGTLTEITITVGERPAKEG